MADMITIAFPAPARTINLNDRMHWTERAKLTAVWRHAVYVHAVNARSHGLRPQPPSDVQFSFGVRDPGRRRDAHNWSPTCKAGIDGLVDAGIFPDDSTEWVTLIDSTFHKGTDVRIEITPMREPW